MKLFKKISFLFALCAIFVTGNLLFAQEGPSLEEYALHKSRYVYRGVPWAKSVEYIKNNSKVKFQKVTEAQHKSSQKYYSLPVDIYVDLNSGALFYFCEDMFFEAYEKHMIADNPNGFTPEDKEAFVKRLKKIFGEHLERSSISTDDEDIYVDKVFDSNNKTIENSAYIIINWDKNEVRAQTALTF